GGGGGGRGRDGTGACDPLASACAEDLVCDALVSGEARCVTPLLIRGLVLDALDDSPIEGALVQAVDANGAAVGTSGATDAAGVFTLTVPAIRDEDGTPVEGSYTLRAQAADYQEFPTAIRPALPLDADTAAAEESGWVIDNPLTTVKLIPLPGDTSALGSISGIVQAERNAGLLVVAEGAGAALTGFSDSEGSYTIFNVPAGAYTVQGYAAGVQLVPATTSLAASEEKTGVDLAESDRPLSAVSGSVQIVNAPGGSVTSVVLAVESTFVEAAARGKVPPGLRAGDVTGAFIIEDVPDGRYVVLAAFENDDLVRDPDQTIGGTRIVRIEVPDPELGNTVTLPEGFKVTEALDVIAPGAEGPQEVVTPTPEFEWQDDSSEDGYEIRVFDAFGNEIWSDEAGSVSGSATVTHTYAGPALEAGMFYQFRTTSFRERTEERTAISSTEDLRGVFVYLAGE
ncbi:MAG: collagen binding domain-containing protein, partial [Planctomycetota bacterium]